MHAVEFVEGDSTAPDRLQAGSIYNLIPLIEKHDLGAEYDPALASTLSISQHSKEYLVEVLEFCATPQEEGKYLQIMIGHLHYCSLKVLILLL